MTMQIKEIPPRPTHYDGIVCVYFLKNGTSVQALTVALSRYGDVVSCKVLNPAASLYLEAEARFSSHDAAVVAAKMGVPELVTEQISHASTGRARPRQRRDRLFPVPLEKRSRCRLRRCESTLLSPPGPL